MSDSKSTTTSGAENKDEPARTVRQPRLASGRPKLDVVGLVLPLGGVLAAFALGVARGLSTGVLILAATALLVAIWQLWSSLQLIADDEEPRARSLPTIPNNLEDEQKAFLLRALEDLDFERSVGKIDEDDFRDLRSKYLERAKAALAQGDEDLHRFRQEAARLVESSRGARSDRSVTAVDEVPDDTPGRSSERIACPKCKARNELDAQFCKQCGAPIARSDDADRGTSG